MTEKQIQKKLLKIICKYTDVKKSTLHASTDLKKDLGLSSFDYVSIISDIEQVFSISLDNQDEIENIYVVEDICKIIGDTLQSSNTRRRG